jgi:hypothetical protein
VRGIRRCRETKDAQDAIGAFPFKDGAYPAFPERDPTMAAHSEIIT